MYIVHFFGKIGSVIDACHPTKNATFNISNELNNILFNIYKCINAHLQNDSHTCNRDSGHEAGRTNNYCLNLKRRLIKKF